MSCDFRTALAAQTMLHGNELKDYVRSYGNPAINFATDDMGSDMSMGGVILDFQRIKKIPMDQALKNVE